MFDILTRKKAAALAELKRRERRARLATYRDDPVGYATAELGLTLTPDQERGLRSIVTHRRTAWKASHAIGKTMAAAIAANFWYDCWDEHIVYITAPTWDQAKGLTFKAIKQLRRQKGLPGEVQETGWVKDQDRARAASHFIRVINAESGEGFQGEHSAPILIIMEEAVGVPTHIWQATDGLLTHPDCRVLAVANPTDEATPFGQACADPLYHVLTVSVFDHPNIALEMEARPPLFDNAVRLLWLKEMLARECTVVPELAGDAFGWWSLPTIDDALGGLPASENPAATRWYYQPNAVFQGRALGNFPTALYEQVIPKNWLERLGRIEVQPSWMPEVGADIARFGDDRTCFARRRGPCLMTLTTVRQLDLTAVTNALRLELNAAGAEAGCDPTAVPCRIDVTGGLGAGPADALKAEGYNVIGVNSSETADDPETYPNRRSELWFACRDRAYTHDLDLSRLAADDRLTVIRELSSVKWKPDARGRKVVEGKDVLKGRKRLGYSPDAADAVNLAFAPIVAITADDEPDIWGGHGRF